MRSYTLEGYWQAQHLKGERSFKAAVAKWLAQATVGQSHAALASKTAPMLVLRHPDGSHSAHFALRCELWNSFEGPSVDSRVVLAFDGVALHDVPALSPCQNCQHSLVCSLASERKDTHAPASSWLG